MEEATSLPPKEIVSSADLTASEEMMRLYRDGTERAVMLADFFQTMKLGREKHIGGDEDLYRVNSDETAIVDVTERIVEKLLPFIDRMNESGTLQAKIGQENKAGEILVFLGGEVGRNYGVDLYIFRTGLATSMQVYRGDQSGMSNSLISGLSDYKPNCDLTLLVSEVDQERVLGDIQTEFAGSVEGMCVVTLREKVQMVMGADKETGSMVYFIMEDPNVSMRDDWRGGDQQSNTQRRVIGLGHDVQGNLCMFESDALLQSIDETIKAPAYIERPEYSNVTQALNALLRMVIPKAYQLSLQDYGDLFDQFDRETVKAFREQFLQFFDDHLPDDGHHGKEVLHELMTAMSYHPAMTAEILTAVGMIGLIEEPDGERYLHNLSRSSDYDWQENELGKELATECMRLEQSYHALGWQEQMKNLRRGMGSQILVEAKDNVMARRGGGR